MDNSEKAIAEWNNLFTDPISSKSDSLTDDTCTVFVRKQLPETPKKTIDELFETALFNSLLYVSDAAALAAILPAYKFWKESS